MARADYEVIGASSDVVYLVDLDEGGKSVTNDAEAVVSEVAAEYPECRIVYRDTMGRWDELVHTDGIFEDFKPWSGQIEWSGAAGD